jgi:ABC-type nitrate/sulfonate/bicarbonate transport system permease component
MDASVGLGRSIDVARVPFNAPAIFLLLIFAEVVGLVLDKLLSAGLRSIGHWLGNTAKG